MTELRQSSPFAGLSVIEDPEKARREAQEMAARMFSEGMSASDIVNAIANRPQAMPTLAAATQLRADRAARAEALPRVGGRPFDPGSWAPAWLRRAGSLP